MQVAALPNTVGLNVSSDPSDFGPSFFFFFGNRVFSYCMPVANPCQLEQTLHQKLIYCRVKITFTLVNYASVWEVKLPLCMP